MARSKGSGADARADRVTVLEDVVFTLHGHPEARVTASRLTAPVCSDTSCSCASTFITVGPGENDTLVQLVTQAPNWAQMIFM